MQSWLTLVALLLSGTIFTWTSDVEAAACAKICYTTALTGFGPGGTPGCSCSGSEAGARTGEGDCNCGQCYTKTQGVIYGFAVNSDGTCTYGTNCGDCDYSPGPSLAPPTSTSFAPATPTASPSPTLVPVPTTSQPSISPGSESSDSSSSSSLPTSSFDMDSNSASTTAYTDNSDKMDDNSGASDKGLLSDKGLRTWQIVLAICCIVVVFVIVVVSVCSCYFKARSRLNEHEDSQASYFDQQPHTFQPWVASSVAAKCTKSPVAV